MMKQFGGTGGPGGGLGGVDMAELQAMMGGAGGNRNLIKLPFIHPLSSLEISLVLVDRCCQPSAAAVSMPFPAICRRFYPEPFTRACCHT